MNSLFPIYFAHIVYSQTCLVGFFLFFSLLAKKNPFLIIAFSISHLFLIEVSNYLSLGDMFWNCTIIQQRRSYKFKVVTTRSYWIVLDRIKKDTPLPHPNCDVWLFGKITFDYPPYILHYIQQILKSLAFPDLFFSPQKVLYVSGNWNHIHQQLCMWLTFLILGVAVITWILSHKKKIFCRFVYSCSTNN